VVAVCFGLVLNLYLVSYVLLGSVMSEEEEERLVYINLMAGDSQLPERCEE